MLICKWGSKKVVFANLFMQSILIQSIKESQRDDPKLLKILEHLHSYQYFSVLKDGSLTFKGRLCVPCDPAIKRELLDEAHHTKYTIHPESTKMYLNLCGMYR